MLVMTQSSTWLDFMIHSNKNLPLYAKLDSNKTALTISYADCESINEPKVFLPNVKSELSSLLYLNPMHLENNRLTS